MYQQIIFRDELLYPIWEKIQTGQRLNLEDGVTMYKTSDLISVGKMAHYMQQQKSGDAVYLHPFMQVLRLREEARRPRRV